MKKLVRFVVVLVLGFSVIPSAALADPGGSGGGGVVCAKC